MTNYLEKLNSLHQIYDINDKPHVALEDVKPLLEEVYTKGRSDEAKTCEGCKGKCEKRIEEAVREAEVKLLDRVIEMLSKYDTYEMARPIEELQTLNPTNHESTH